MGVITRIGYTEHVSVVTFESVPANIKFLSKLFDTAAAAGVNVDMISQTAPKGRTTSISFTVIDSNVKDILQVINTLTAENEIVKPLVTIGNVKISLYGEDMPNNIGVASDVFAQLAKLDTSVILITTSDVDISILVQSADSERVYNSLREVYLGEAPTEEVDSSRKPWQF